MWLQATEWPDEEKNAFTNVKLTTILKLSDGNSEVYMTPTNNSSMS